MSHCVVPKRYPYLPKDGSLVWTCHPVPPPWNFQFSFTLHFKKMAVQSPKITLVVGIDVFWNCKIEKYSEIFRAPFFYLFPLATALTREMSYSPKRRLIRERVTLLALMTVHARIVCSQTPVPHQMPRGPDCFSDRQLKNWFDLQFLSQPLIFVW